MPIADVVSNWQSWPKCSPPKERPSLPRSRGSSSSITCGSIGPVEAKYRDCCPDGNEARQIPLALAEKCRATFKMAIELMIEAEQTTPEARAAAGGKAH